MTNLKPEKKSKTERLHKTIANAGYTSRRKAEALIREGKVSVNGEVVEELGFLVNPKEDHITVDGTAIDPGATEKMYLVLNKPRGFITSRYDPEGRPTVMDLCKDIPQSIYPVGRLDFHSEGLLIMTNDGDLANKIIHPSFNITKVYEVKVFGSVTDKILKALKAGIRMDGKLVQPKSVRIIQILPQKTWLEFRLMEGKNREIRRFCEACGLTVDKLRRVAIESLSIDGIPVGHYKILSKTALMRALGMMNSKDREKEKEREKGKEKEKSPAKGKEIKEIKVPRNPFEYRSPKRSVIPGKTPLREAPLANDPTYIKYRKKHYQATMEFWKENEEKIAQDESREKENQTGKSLGRKVMKKGPKKDGKRDGKIVGRRGSLRKKVSRMGARSRPKVKAKANAKVRKAP